MKRKFLSFVSLVAILIVSLCAIVACTPADKANLKASVVSSTDTVILIQVEDVSSETDTLMDAMSILQENGALDYTVSGGMIQTINGKANKADWSACWMIYTSDSEMGNSEWGTYEYDGVSYASAVLGAESLPLLKGAFYLWVYTSL